MSSNKNIILIKNLIKRIQLKYTDLEIERSLVYYYLLSCKLEKKYKNLGLEGEIRKEILEELDTIFEKKITIYDLAFLFEDFFNDEVKSSNGIVFTPKYISEFIIKNALKTMIIKDDIKILDPACGSGIFLLVALEILASTLKKSKLDIVKENLYGIDIIKENTKRTILLLKLACIKNLEKEIDFEKNIITGDSLKESWIDLFSIKEFDLIIGNPPYVNPHDLAKETVVLLKNNFISTKKGTINIFYAFLEKSMEFISDTGKVSYIIPNNFLTITAAKELRKYLIKNTYMEYILDFTSNLIFKPVRSYNSIVVLSKGLKSKLKYSLIPYNDNIELELRKLEVLDIDYVHLNENRWNLLKKDDLENIKKIETIGIPLKKMIKTGVATLKDEVYLIDYYDFRKKRFCKEYEGENFYIESDLIKSTYKISEIKDPENIKKYEKFIIFPYKKNAEGKFSIIEEERLKSKYPEGYKYFLKIKDVLDTRDKGKINTVAWYAYGRTQGLNNYGRKLLYPTFANTPKFYIIEDKDTLYFNGYSILENSGLELEVLQKILNSKIMKYYVDKTSYPIEGGYMCYQKKYIQDFSIPDLSEEDKKFIKEEKNKYHIDEFLLRKYKINID